MTTTTVDQAVTEPGVYELPDEVYFADPVPGGSLSNSGAKLLLDTCPAKFAHRRYSSEHRTEFDIGHAAHKLVLGSGPELWVVEANDWKTKDAQEQRKQAYADGHVPLLRKQFTAVHDMAEALKAHPWARKLFAPERGEPEQALFWTDPDYDVVRRAKLDVLPYRTDGRMILADYKTCEDASKKAAERAMANYRYYMQAAWYSDLVLGLGLAEEVAFVFVMQEKTPPYLVNVVEPDPAAIRAGRADARKALEMYRDCTESGVWPGYSTDVELIGLPRWMAAEYEVSW